MYVRTSYLNGMYQMRRTEYLNSTTLSVLRPSPAGLMALFGHLVAHPTVFKNEGVNTKLSNSTLLQQCSLHDQERRLDCCNFLSSATSVLCSNRVVYKDLEYVCNAMWSSKQSEELVSDELF